MSGMMLAFSGGSYGAAPVNTVAPVVSGTATVGQTLTTTNGTWTGAPAPTFTYQWQRSAVNISGATSSTYVLVAADYANTIRCVVKATNTIAPAGVTANSNSTASVAGNAPVNTVAPAVTGTATVGQTLTTTNGTWTGTPTPTFTYQWQRVTTNISAATSSTYVLVAADVGNTIRCVVTATNAVSAVSANSNATASVTAVTGQQAYTSAGTYTWVAPAGVTKVSVVALGYARKGGNAFAAYCAGANDWYGAAGGGGDGSGLVYGNNITVVAGNSYSVRLGSCADGLSTFFNSTAVLQVCANGSGSGTARTAGFSGGGGGPGSCGGGSPSQACQLNGNFGSGAGGAAGYSGNGGHGATGAGSYCQGLTAGAGGGGGGGGGGNAYSGFNSGVYVGGGGGGGVGILGAGSNGAAGTNWGVGGSGGSSGTSGSNGSGNNGGSGGTYGGGGGGASRSGSGASGGATALRIIWPGCSRSFPSTNTGDL